MHEIVMPIIIKKRGALSHRMGARDTFYSPSEEEDETLRHIKKEALSSAFRRRRAYHTHAGMGAHRAAAAALMASQPDAYTC